MHVKCLRLLLCYYVTYRSDITWKGAPGMLRICYMFLVIV